MASSSVTSFNPSPLRDTASYSLNQRNTRLAILIGCCTGVMAIVGLVFKKVVYDAPDCTAHQYYTDGCDPCRKQRRKNTFINIADKASPYVTAAAALLVIIGIAQQAISAYRGKA